MQGRRDLVLAMTLAEVFLLLLFVVWIASRAQAGEIDLPGLQRKIASLDEQVKQFKKDNEELKAWKVAYERFITGLGYELPKTPDGAVLLPGGGNGGKDWPACEPGRNRLLQGGVISGELRIRFLREFSPSGIQAGSELQGVSAEDTLAKVEGFQIRSHCRFHYRLEFVSNSDYRLGRQRMERVFYPDGELQLQ